MTIPNTNIFRSVALWNGGNSLFIPEISSDFMGTFPDLNGNGQAFNHSSGGTSTGAADVVPDRTKGIAVHLTEIVADAGGSMTGFGDVNAVGLADNSIESPRSAVRWSTADTPNTAIGTVGYALTASIPNTKVFISTAISNGSAYRFLPEAAGDFALTFTGDPVPAWVSGIADLNGDGITEVIMGAPGSNDKAPDAGRVFVVFGQATGGTTQTLGDIAMTNRLIIIDGVKAGDRAGASVGSVSDLNGDGRAEILVGAPGMEKTTAIDAGAGFVLWGRGVAGGIDLADPFSGSGNGKGYAIKGEAAGDNAGTFMTSIADLNGDGKAEILISAPGNDGNGADAGAVYVVFGKSNDAVVQLTSVAGGTGGFKIIGEDNGDAIGLAVSTIGDLNGDGKAEILIGASNNGSGGTHNGAAYVVYGKATGTAVSLTNVAAGIGGFKIIGQAGDDAGGSITGLGDVNADGLADMLIGAPRSDRAYMVFGKADTINVNLANVAVGTGGYLITAQNVGDLDKLAVTGGADLNRDGIKDLVISAPDNGEGGSHAGAVYVVWGGGTGTIDLNLVAQGIGGAKIVGTAGSYFGSSVAIIGDQNGDGISELLIGSNGTGAESATVLFAPGSWQPDNNIYGTLGNDSMGFGFGGLHKIDDTANAIFGLDGNDSIAGAGGNDAIDGGTGNDTLNGDAGNDTLDGGTGNDVLNGGAGDDVFVVDSALDVINENVNEGTDTVQASINFTIGANLEALILTTSGHTGTGNAGANTLTGSGGNDVLNGASGNDTLNGNTGDDTLDGGTGDDSMAGGTGNDSYIVDTAGDTVQESLNNGIDSVQSAIDYTLGPNVENLTLTGTATHGTGNPLANVITGGGNDDSLFGMDGNDTLNGNNGNDSIDGGTGADLLTGGNGNDSYFIDNGGDVVVEGVGGGIDTIIASLDRGLDANVENLTLTGTAIHGTGNALDNAITGTTGDNVLDGGAGMDTMLGGNGNDTYVVDNASDVVQEGAGAGIDTIQSSLDYTLGANVENLTLTVAGHTGTGNALANTLTGTSGKDTLDGAGGNDTLSGGTGDDTYHLDSLSDAVQEGAGNGTDTVIAHIDGLTLAGNVENLILADTAHSATGNELNNTMTGGTGNDTLNGGLGNDTLDGGAGADLMTGGAGDDTYYIDNPSDGAIEDIGGGNDTVVVDADWTVGNNIENIRLTGTGHTATGNAENNTLSGGNGDDTFDGAGGDDTEIGNDGNDTLISIAGHDTLVGGAGDDTFKIHGGAARIEDFLGYDTLDASDSTTDDHIDLSGETETEIEHEICDIGNGGQTSQKLDVQFLQDLTGSFTDDLPNVKALVPDIVTAIRAVQTDSEFGSSTFVDKPISPFGAPGEWPYETRLALTADANTLIATYNAMFNLSGNDTPESQLEALMQVALRQTEVGYRPDSARFVVLFTDAPFHVAGDGALAGITTANNGDTVLDGTPPGTGEDYPVIAQVKLALETANIIPIFAIAGGLESTYQGLVTDLGRGTVVTLTSNSSNIVQAISDGLTLATQTVIEEARGGSGNDNILGNTADNSLSGNAGNDALDGRDGNDRLTGGAGNDLLTGGNGDDTAIYGGNRINYQVVHTGIDRYTVTDLRLGSVEGIDTLNGVENLQFADSTITVIGATTGVMIQGTAAADLINATHTPAGQPLPTAGDDAMIGLAGNDRLDGGLGADTMTGGLGNDIYTIDNLLDQTIENLAEGTDTVRASISWTLADNMENLTLTGTDAIDGTGNDLVNVLTGNDAVNTLTGNGGNDTLVGAGGNDTLTGGLGNDSIDGGDGNDSIEGGTGNDTVIGGNGDDLFLFNDTITTSYDAVDGGAGNDTILAGVDKGIIGLTTLAGIEKIDGGGHLAVTILGNSATQNWDFSAITLIGIATINAGGGTDAVIGSAGADSILGNTGADTLTGGGGNDSLNGGAGVDILTGGAGTDRFVYTTTADSAVGSADTILDFSQPARDRIDLTKIDANSLLSGNQSFSWIGDVAFSGVTAGELREVVGLATTSVFGDVNGDGLADFQIDVSGAPTLTVASFFL